MYGVKRVAESTGYALTFGEEAKARRHLEQAQRRLDEVEGMVARDQAEPARGAAVDPADSERVRSTMQEFDSDATEGSRLLLAGQSPDTAQVDDVREWATEQSTRLSELKPTLPAHDKADESLALLNRVLGQTGGLQDAVCDPTVEACPDVSVTDPAETGLTSDPDGTRSAHAGGQERAARRHRHGRGPDGDDTDDPTSSDDEQAPSGARPRQRVWTTGRSNSDGSSGSGGSSGSAVPPAVPPLPAKAASRRSCRGREQSVAGRGTPVTSPDVPSGHHRGGPFGRVGRDRAGPVRHPTRKGRDSTLTPRPSSTGGTGGSGRAGSFRGRGGRGVVGRARRRDGTRPGRPGRGGRCGGRRGRRAAACRGWCRPT